MTKKAKWGNDTRLENSRLFVMRSEERIAQQPTDCEAKKADAKQK
ncbi:hypothetical protein [Campylobacter sp.]|nr:hypothetical protein [Campylobacter sp.]